MGTFAPGQIVVVFRNRLHPDGIADYGARATEIEGLARQMPGFVDVKSFVADDGERVTISTFADEDSVKAWRDHAEHRVAQQEGRSTFYAEYTIQVAETRRASEFTRPDRTHSGA
jgi:heme-degrading monooxygenase HmoA